MKRIARLMEAPLAEKILGGEIATGDTVLLVAEDGTVTLDTLDGKDRPTAAE